MNGRYALLYKKFFKNFFKSEKSLLYYSFYIAKIIENKMQQIFNTAVFKFNFVFISLFRKIINFPNSCFFYNLDNSRISLQLKYFSTLHFKYKKGEKVNLRNNLCKKKKYIFYREKIEIIKKCSVLYLMHCKYSIKIGAILLILGKIICNLMRENE